MAQFKVGDTVERLNYGHGNFNVGDHGVVAHVQGRFVHLIGDAVGYEHDEINLKLISNADPIADAKVTLEAAGYTITPPKPKETGLVVVYRSIASGHTFNCAKDDWYNLSDYHKKKQQLLAILPWTEGDGL